MKKYIVRRFFLFLFLVIAVSTIVFFLLHLVPGDPVTSIVGEGARGEDIQRLRRELNLDKPIIHQYLEFLGNLSNLSFGTSIIHNQPVIAKIIQALPYTVYLAAASMFIALIISFPLGITAAFKENTVTDAVVTLGSSVGLAVPNFFWGPLLIILFSIKLDWLPVSGSESFTHIILPALTLGTSISALLTRIIKSALVTELKKPYILLARAKGLTQGQILTKHLLKNALIPIITTIGLQLGALLTGAVITETVFSWQGLGMLMVTAIKQRDYPMVQGVIVFITLVYLTLNFLVDLSYFFIDPRIKHEFAKS